MGSPHFGKLPFKGLGLKENVGEAPIKEIVKGQTFNGDPRSL